MYPSSIKMKLLNGKMTTLTISKGGGIVTYKRGLKLNPAAMLDVVCKVSARLEKINPDYGTWVLQEAQS